MNPTAALLGRLAPSGPSRPAEPLLAPEEVARQLAEVGADRGVSRHILGPVSSALAQRMRELGEAEDRDSGWSAALRVLPGPEGDVFVGRSLDRQDQNPAERALRTAAWARAGAEVLQEAAEQHPALLSLRFDQGGATRLEALEAGPASVAVVVMKGVWTLDAPAGRPVAELAAEIGTALASGRFRRIEEAGPQRAPLAVLSDRRTLQHARHGHRANGLQGPWACLAPASRSAHGPPMELMGGFSLVADHALLADLAARTYRLADHYLATLPEGTFQWLGRSMTRGFVDAWRAPESSVHRPPQRAREEFLAAPAPRGVPLDRLTWATGLAAQQLLGLRGEHGIPTRVDGRPPTLSAVRFVDGVPEDPDAFSARLAQQRVAEEEGRGLLGDSLRRTAGQVAAPADRSRLLARVRAIGPLPGPYWWLPGIARVSRIEASEPTPWALHAGASPPGPPPLAPIPGGLSVTLIEGPERSELGLVGSGAFSADGALGRLVEAITAAL